MKNDRSSIYGRKQSFLVLLYCLLGIVALGGCQGDTVPPPADAEPEGVQSLLGNTLIPPAMSAERKAVLEANYAEAKAVYDADPNQADNIIWLGRRAAYLWNYNEAIDVFSSGIEAFPEDPRMYRHRGHRYITVRSFDQAIADFEKAVELIAGKPDEVEPDGAPNAAGIPTSTLHTNIWYHLGLARYLKGDFEGALEAYLRCMEASKNNDMDVATADWLYMTLRRLGREDEAAKVLEPITADMELLENFAYHRRHLMYKGLTAPDVLLSVGDDSDPALTLATQGYGVGNWYLYNGDEARAREIFEDVLEGEYWAAFGYIAAEAELAR